MTVYKDSDATESNSSEQRTSGNVQLSLQAQKAFGGNFQQARIDCTSQVFLPPITLDTSGHLAVSEQRHGGIKPSRQIKEPDTSSEKLDKPPAQIANNPLFLEKKLEGLTRLENKPSHIALHYSGREDGLRLGRDFKGKNGQNGIRSIRYYEDGQREITDIHGKTKIEHSKKQEPAKNTVKTFDGRADGRIKEEETSNFIKRSFEGRKDGLQSEYLVKPALHGNHPLRRVLKYEDGHEEHVYSDGRTKTFKSQSKQKK